MRQRFGEQTVGPVFAPRRAQGQDPHARNIAVIDQLACYFTTEQAADTGNQDGFHADDTRIFRDTPHFARTRTGQSLDPSIDGVDNPFGILYETGFVAVWTLDCGAGITGFIVADPQFAVLYLPACRVTARGGKHRLFRLARQVDNLYLAGMRADVTTDQHQASGIRVRPDQVEAGAVVILRLIAEIGEVTGQIINAKQLVALVYRQATFIGEEIVVDGGWAGL